MPSDLADHAYGHCVAVLLDRDAAVRAAAVALRRGGRARSTLLAFARAAALDAAEADPPALDAAALATAQPADLNELALALSATRPPVERAVVDLDVRHGLDRAGLARALGLGPTEAAALAAMTADEWGHELDPALLAWLGPSGCDGLAEVLVAAGLWTFGDPADGAASPDDDEADEAGEAGEADERSGVATAHRTVADVLTAVPAVRTHVEGCDACADRRLAMVTVRSLLGQRPLERAPEPVRVASRRNPFRVAPLPAPAPAYATAAVGSRSWFSSRAARLGVGAGTVLIVAAAAVGIAYAARQPSGQDRRKHRVAALTKLPAAATSLVLTPPEVHPSTGAMLLRNRSNKTVRWNVTTAASWLEVAPGAGTLNPGGAAELDTRILPAAPEGDQRVAVTVTGDDGSSAATLVDTTVEHPPTLAAHITACTVEATAEDESEITSVFLHWLPAGTSQEHLAAMPAAGPPGSFVADLPADEHPATWWVSAVDGRGNRALTPDAAVPPGGCTS